jgi:hypothetical protein
MADGTIVIDTSIDKKKIDSQVSSIKSNITTGFKAAAKAGAIALAGITAAIGAVAGASVKIAATADRVDKLSQKIGLSRTAFQEWDFILSQSGASVDGLQMSLKTLSNGAAKAKDGTAEYADEFKRLGVQVTDTNGNLKSSEVLFNEVFGALSNMTDETQRTATASKLLGRSATELAPAMNGGSDAIEAMREQAHELGLVLGDDIVDAGVKLTDSIDQLKRMGTSLMANFLGPVLPYIDAIVQGLIDMINGVDGAAKAFGEKMSDVIQIIIDKIVAFLPQAFSYGGKIIVEMAKGIITALPTIVEQLSYMLGYLIGVISVKLPEFLQKGKDFILNLIDGMNEDSEGLLSNLGAMVSGLVTWLLDNAKDFIVGGAEIVAKIIQGIYENGPLVLAEINRIVTSALQWITDNAPDMIQSGIELVTNLAQGILTSIPLIVAEIANILSTVLSWITTNAPDFIASGIELVANLAKGVLDSIPLIVDEIANIVGTIVSWITANAPDMVASGIELITNLIQGIANSIPAIVSKLTEIIGAMIKWFADNAPDLIVSGALLVAKLIVGIINAIPTIVTAGLDLIAGLAKALVDSWPTLKEKGKEAVGKLIEGLKESAGNISSEAIAMGSKIISGIIYGTMNLKTRALEILKAIPDAIKEKTKDVIDGAKAIGVNLIDGFITGFESIKDKVRDKIMAFFDLIPEGIRKLLGIASPSKVTKKIGGYFAEGFADGIEDGKTGVMRSAEDIAEIAVETVEASVPDAKVAGTNLANAVDQGVKDKKPAISATWKSVLDDMSTNTTTWVGTIQSVIGTLKGAFASTMQDIGEAIATGGLSWDIFAKAGLNALADVLAAIGQQLTAMAVLKLVQWDWSGAAIAGAGAAAAFVASGYISSKAASYDVGGIIDRDQLANIHQGETILPKGITADMKSAGLMIQPLGRNSATSPTMYGIINLDGREIARAVFKHTDSNVGLAYTG